MRISAILAFGLLTVCCASCKAGDGASIPNAAAFGFCVCSPGPVSDKISVEFRLGIKNLSSREQAYDITFFLDKAEPSGVIHTESVSVKGESNLLVSHWWPTAGHIGSRKIIYKVDSEGKTVSRGEWPLEILPSDTSALPWAQCVWLDPGNLAPSHAPGRRVPGNVTSDDVRAMVDSMRDIGATFILISYVEGVAFGGGTYYPSKIPELGKNALGFDMLDALLDQAARNGQHVIIGLGRGPDMTLCYEGVKDPERLGKALDLGKRVAQELWDMYSHHPSFYGWYLSHEPTDLVGAGAFLNPITDYMHDLASEKPVVVAPSGTPTLSPKIISEVHYDVLTYQDAVGPGYIPYVYTWNPEKRMAMLDDVCRSYRAAHYNTNKHLWSDTETWEMKGPNYGDPYPASFSRLIRQLGIQKNYYQTLTMYEFMATMSPPDLKIGLKDERATKLYQEYKRYYEVERKKAREKAALVKE